MKSAQKYLNHLGLDLPEKLAIARLLFGNTELEYSTLIKGRALPDDFHITIRGILGKMQVVNKMVKHESCPNNIRNRFYKYKHRIIKEYHRRGEVTDVYDEGNCYGMLVKGYPFHQLKGQNDDYNVLGTREYRCGEDPIPFDMQNFVDFQMSAILFLNRMKKQPVLSETNNI